MHDIELKAGDGSNQWTVIVDDDVVGTIQTYDIQTTAAKIHWTVANMGIDALYDIVKDQPNQTYEDPFI